MMARRGVLGMLAGGAAALLSGCGLFNSKASFRYRMIVEGGVSGNAVYELRAEQNNDVVKLPEERMGGAIIKGEALVMETANGPVFVLLKSERDADDLIGALVRALAPDIPWNGQPNFFKAVERLEENTGIKAELPREHWPMMVRFADINDPKSVEQVDPASIGVKRITVETTGDDVTTGIEKRLGWLGTSPKFSDKFEKYNGWIPENEIGIAERIGPRDFSTELGK